MTDRLRIRIATAVVALFLAAVSAAGVVVHTSRPPAAIAPVTHTAAGTRSRGATQPITATPWQEQEHD